ncbi:MAG: transposase [Kiritimatiellae bacterium]|nr:transposase [Kiritimatiellia bacterium]
MNPTPFLDKREPLQQTQNDLPHWHQPLRLQFFTWNLGDALPVKAMARLKRERESWLYQHPKPWSDEEYQIYFERFTDRIDRWLALGRGESIFREVKAAGLMAEVLQFHEGKKMRMDAFVIMPNHIHCLAQLCGETTVSELMHSWRSYSALQLNRLRNRKGKLWSEDFWDRVIRSPENYWHVRKYIKDNPRKANLSEGNYLLWMRDTPLWRDLQREGYVVRSKCGELPKP